VRWFTLAVAWQNRLRTFDRASAPALGYYLCQHVMCERRSLALGAGLVMRAYDASDEHQPRSF
jgi:hypothetical protein